MTMQPKLLRKRKYVINKLILKLMVIILSLIAATSMAQDIPANVDNTSYSPSAESVFPQKIGSVLLVFIVLSVVFEVALTPIFNWRFFLKHFEGKGYKIPVTIALAFIVFWNYKLDIVKDLLNALNYPAQRSLGGQFLTALLIAGGSDGIFRIFTKLGIRDPTERKTKAKESRKKTKSVK